MSSQKNISIIRKIITILPISIFIGGLLSATYKPKQLLAQETQSLSITKTVNKLHVQRDAPEEDEQNVTYTITVNTDGYCNSPLDIAIAFDRSGSMGEPPEDPEITIAKEATISFINQLDTSTDRIALISYGSTATLDESLSPNFNDVINTVNSLNAGGMTNIGDTLTIARNDLVTNDRGVEQIILIFTDGVWNSGPDPLPIATSIKNDDGIRIISVGIGTDVDQNFLATIASSPEDYYLVEHLENLTETFINIARNLQYGDTEIIVTDDISQILAYADFVSASNGGYLSDSTLTWHLGADPCGDSVNVQFLVRVKPDTPDLSELLNTATAVDTASDLHATSQEVKTIVHAPILELTKTSGWSQVTPGTEIDYSIHVRNIGSGNAYNVSLVDDLPSNYFSIFENTISDNGILVGNSVIWDNNGIGYIFDGSFAPTNSPHSVGSEHTFSYSGRIDSNCPIGENIINSVTLSTSENYTVQTNSTIHIGDVLAATGDPHLAIKLLVGLLLFLASVVLVKIGKVKL